MSIRGLISLACAACIALIGALVVLVQAERANANAVAAAEHRRHQSYQAAIHLMQTSNDLTRMARQFVITGDPQFDRYYHRILAIRNGTASRPPSYDPFYWDRVLAGTEALDEASPPMPLRQLLRDLSFTQQELDALDAAQTESDRLAQIEEVAIRSIRDKALRRLPGRPLDNAAETDAMANAAYQQAKGRIMSGIQACLTLVDRRTSRAVAALQAKGLRLRNGILLGTGGLLLLIGASVGVVIWLVLRPVGVLVEAARRVGRGDYSVRVPAQRSGEFRRLALAFNQMKDAVERNIQRLADSEARARETSQRLQQITDHVPGSLYDFRIEPSGKMHFDFVSPGLSMPGVTAEQFVVDARNAFATVIEEDRAPLMASIKAAMSPPRPWFYEYRVRLPDGRIRWVRGQSRPAAEPAKDGSRHWFGFLTDVTAQKELEAALAHAREAAEAGSRAKSAFLATMSHELRTPMIGVTGMLEVLLHGDLTPEQRRQIAIIQQSARSLLAIIGEVLDFSKIEAGKLELAPVHVSIRRLVETLANNFRDAASSKGLQLACSVDERLAAAHQADTMRLRQILSNFLSNALKFTQHGSIQLNVEVLQQEADGQKLRLSVTDTGIGISEEDQKKLFQPFQQAESSTTRRHGGTGLGLIICRRLAELMGGEVGLHSQLGVGTTMEFIVALPLGEAARIEEAEFVLPQRQWKHRKPGSPAEAQAERSLILLVEDHPTNRIVLSHQFDLAGFVLDIAEDGEQGLEKWKSGRYALVFTDLHMPRMDGLQLTVAIRQAERERGLSRTPVIALTAAALKDQRERCLEAGMDDVVFKPTTIGSLSASLHQWLPQLSWERAAPPPVPRPAERGGAGETGLPRTAVPAAIDEAVLSETAGGDAELGGRILEDFVASTRGDLQALSACRADHDRPGMVRNAHRLLGASRMVGASGLAQAAAALEGAGREADWPAVAQGITAVDAAFQTVLAYAAKRTGPAWTKAAP